VVGQLGPAPVAIVDLVRLSGASGATLRPSHWRLEQGLGR